LLRILDALQIVEASEEGDFYHATLALDLSLEVVALVVDPLFATFRQKPDEGQTSLEPLWIEAHRREEIKIFDTRWPRYNARAVPP
jgi:hypothetical protein